MEDLRLLAVEQDFVVLESSNGEKFRLALDETLRRAIRQDRSVSMVEATVSPREIQELVRSGVAIDDVVAKTGAPTAYIEKFAAPVLDEITHILKSALSVRLSFLNDRFGEPSQIEFGALMREKLSSIAAADPQWSARKIEGGSWQIRCNFQVGSSESLAIWSFDLRRMGLSPENEVALNLGVSQDAVAPLISKTNPVLPFASAVKPISPTNEAEANGEQLVSRNLTSSLGETQEFAEIIPFGRSRGNTQNVPVIAAGTSAEIDAEPFDDGEYLDDNGDLLESLRRRRDAREQTNAFRPLLNVVDASDFDDFVGSEVADLDDSAVWIESSDEVLRSDDQEILRESDFDEKHSEDDNVSPPPNRRGRALMPSWDEIVFGTKPDSKDDF